MLSICLVDLIDIQFTYTLYNVHLQDELPKEVNSPTGKTSVRNVTIRDDSGAISVALWQEHAQESLRVGDRVKITHLSPKKDGYLKRMVLSTTTNTKLQVCKLNNFSGTLFSVQTFIPILLRKPFTLNVNKHPTAKCKISVLYPYISFIEFNLTTGPTAKC